MVEKSYSESYAAAGVDITAGYRAVELMKKHVARTRNEGCLDDVGSSAGASSSFFLPISESLFRPLTRKKTTRARMAKLMTAEMKLP